MGAADAVQQTLESFSDDCGDKPWRNKDWLYKYYWGLGETTAEMADRVDAAQQTISRNMRNNGIQRRGGSVDVYLFQMRPRKWLFNEYWVKRKDLLEIAAENSVSQRTVQWTFEVQDPPIIVRPKHSSGSFHHNYKSYAKRYKPSDYGELNGSYVDIYVGDGVKIREHRIVAIGEYGLDTVKDKVLHHSNELKWFNVARLDIDIPELENPNIVPMSSVRHSQIHP